MAISLAVLDADLAASEVDQAEIGAVVTVTLPDSFGVVTGTRMGSSNSFGMELAGLEEKRRDEVLIRGYVLLAINGITDSVIRDWAKLSTVTIENKVWNIESVVSGDSAAYTFKLVQSW